MDAWPWINFALFVGLTLALGGGLLFLGRVLGPRRPLPEKLDPYECGVPLMDSSRHRFNVKFYLVAIMFMLFDIEAVFLIPWAAVALGTEWVGLVLVEMLVFLAILGFGLVYIYRRGVLDW